MLRIKKKKIFNRLIIVEGGYAVINDEDKDDKPIEKHNNS
jgi:hypothetical protein